MISWSYYGERCWAWLFGDHTSTFYRLLFVVFVFIGSVLTATNVLGFGDLMILGMAFPNIIGLYILAKEVRFDLKDYMNRIRSGEIRRFK